MQWTGNNVDNIEEVEKEKLDSNTKVCRDFFRLWLVFFILLNASYNL